MGGAWAREGVAREGVLCFCVERKMSTCQISVISSGHLAELGEAGLGLSV